MYARSRFASLVLGVTLVGCSDGTPTSPTTPTMPTPPVVSTGTLTVANESPQSVFFVYIAPCAANSWGADQLGGSEVIASGASRRWVVGAGCYDVRAELSTGRAAEWRNVQLTRGGTQLLRLTQ